MEMGYAKLQALSNYGKSNQGRTATWLAQIPMPSIGMKHVRVESK